MVKISLEMYYFGAAEKWKLLCFIWDIDPMQVYESYCPLFYLAM